MEVVAGSLVQKAEEQKVTSPDCRIDEIGLPKTVPARTPKRYPRKIFTVLKVVRNRSTGSPVDQPGARAKPRRVLLLRARREVGVPIARTNPTRNGARAKVGGERPGSDDAR